MIIFTLTNDELEVLRTFLQRLISETSWLNQLLIDDASGHEIAVVHQIASKLSQPARSKAEVDEIMKYLNGIREHRTNWPLSQQHEGRGS